MVTTPPFPHQGACAAGGVSGARALSPAPIGTGQLPAPARAAAGASGHRELSCLLVLKPGLTASGLQPALLSRDRWYRPSTAQGGWWGLVAWRYQLTLETQHTGAGCLPLPQPRGLPHHTHPCPPTGLLSSVGLRQPGLNRPLGQGVTMEAGGVPRPHPPGRHPCTVGSLTQWAGLGTRGHWGYLSPAPSGGGGEDPLKPAPACPASQDGQCSSGPPPPAPPSPAHPACPATLTLQFPAVEAG